MNYPFTNFQALNLDWFLEEWEEFKQLWDEAEESLQETQSELIQAVNAKIAEIEGMINNNGI